VNCQFAAVGFNVEVGEEAEEGGGEAGDNCCGGPETGFVGLRDGDVEVVDLGEGGEEGVCWRGGLRVVIVIRVDCDFHAWNGGELQIRQDVRDSDSDVVV